MLRKFALLITLITFFGCTQVSQKTETTVPNPITLESSDIFNIYSEVIQQDYRIRIKLPASYFEQTEKRYPIILKLDGQWDFPLAASAYNCIYFDGQMPETIFVGVDWGDIEGDIHAIRSRDLSPTPVPRYPQSGQAKQFVDALEKDIIPELEKLYRLDGRRYLLGGSWSALFATYALLERPQTFDGAIAIAANYHSSKEALDELIQSHRGTSHLKDKRLYIGIGKFDIVAPSVTEFASKLKAAELPGFQLKLDQLAGFGHSGMNIPGYAGGYQYMFQRPVNPINWKLMNSRLGDYHSTNNPQDKMTLSKDADNLIGTNRYGESFKLLSAGENYFYHPGMFLNLTFKNNQVISETFFGQTIYVKSVQ